MTVFELLAIGVIILAVLLSRGNKDQPKSTGNPDLANRNYEWAQFIASYYDKVTTEAEKKLLVRMLGDIAAKGLPTPILPDVAARTQPMKPLKHQQVSTSTSLASDFYMTLDSETTDHSTAAITRNQVQLDNASLLLYFGAFLFVASAGLFVSFSQVGGVLKTAAVVLVGLALYAGGIWLYGNRSKLKQAGVAFTGIGMSVMPLTGLAAYNFIFDQTFGSGVWLYTSLLCLLLYAHALWRLRTPLLHYVFIFTFLSLFQSGISVIEAPVYYFGWGFAALGIALELVCRTRHVWPEFRNSATNSATLLLPLSVLTALFLLPTQGVVQLAVSLLLAAFYYGVQTVGEKPGENRQNNAVVSQLAATAAAMLLAFDGFGIPVGIVVVGSLHLIMAAGVVVMKSQSTEARNGAALLIASQWVLCLLGVALDQSGVALSAALLAAISGVVAWRQKRLDAYAVAALTAVVLPILYCQLYRPGTIDNDVQLLLVAAVLALQLAVGRLIGLYRDSSTHVATSVYMISGFIVLAAGFWATPGVALAVDLAVVLSMLYLTEHTGESTWSDVASLAVLTPLLHTISDREYFLAATVMSLLVQIAISLRHRAELNRWLSTGLWLLLPVSVGSGAFGLQWHAANYTWAYAMIMLLLLLSRAIARGVSFLSFKVPLSAYASSASLSYVFGYCIAAVIALGASLVTPDSQFHTSLLLAGLCAVLILTSEYIEKRSDWYMLLPLLAQGFVFSSIRPEGNEVQQTICLLASSMIAVLGYAWAYTQRPDKRSIPIMQASLVAAFITPFTFMFGWSASYAMPIGLGIAGCLVLWEVRDASRSSRELAGGLITLSIFWIMWIAGIEAVQAYTHVLAAQLALYAYMRSTVQEKSQSDTYIAALLFTVTIPLALQALSGESGGLYGWWLLLEQVAIMLIGMSIGNSFMVRFGLYVAIAAVMYQLRNLGWAALTVLALFLIGLAIHKLLKYNDENEEK